MRCICRLTISRPRDAIVHTVIFCISIRIVNDDETLDVCI